MKCEETRGLLTRYMLDELDDPLRRRVCAHLEECDGCRAEAQSVEPTLDLLRDALAADTPAPRHLSPARRSAVLAALPTPAGTRTPWIVQHRSALAMAAGLLLCLGFLWTAVNFSAVEPYRIPKGRGSPVVAIAKVAKEKKTDPTDRSYGSRYAAPAGRAAASADDDGSKDRDTWEVDAEPAGVNSRAAPKRKKRVVAQPEFSLSFHIPDLDDSGISKNVEESTTLDYFKTEDQAGTLGRAIAGRGGRMGAGGGSDHDDPAPGSDSLRRPAAPPLAAGPEGLREKEDPKIRGEANDELARVKFDQEKYDAARDHLDRALERDPVSVEARILEGRLHLKTKKLAEATQVKVGFATPESTIVADKPFEPQPEDLSPAVVGTTSGSELTVRTTSGDAVTWEAPEEESTGPRFKAAGVNPFVNADKQAFSTFSIDVDTASYTLARNYMLKGYLPPAEAVRTEEFVNFFDYAYAPPADKTFRVHTGCAPSRFGHGLHLLSIGVKGRRLGREEQRPAVLTFLVDTSGSMNKPDRIGLVKTALRLLVNRLAPQDRAAIVQYGSQARLILEHTPASQREKILGAIDGLQCSGSTNLEEGMRQAYRVAGAGFAGGAENRVLLLSDGVANVGTTEAADILAQVQAYRQQGVYCSVFGFGTGTYDDTMLETLANKGNGTYTFLDSEDEARRVFVDDLAATINTIAADVKIQVEFNPERVRRYRQLGYENRQLKQEQFRDDTVDAGEVGSGQSVTALYELELIPVPRSRQVEPIAVVRVRYRRVDTGAVEEIEHPLTLDDVASDFDGMPSRFRLAACVAEFSEILRASPHASGSRFEDVARVLRPVALELSLNQRVQELLRLVQGATGMARGR